MKIIEHSLRDQVKFTILESRTQKKSLTVKISEPKLHGWSVKEGTDVKSEPMQVKHIHVKGKSLNDLLLFPKTRKQNLHEFYLQYRFYFTQYNKIDR